MPTIVFTMTCPVVGESYDVTYNGQDLGWARLRHSRFIARNPEAEPLLTVDFTGQADDPYGCFYPDIAMRDAYLSLAADTYAQVLGLEGEVFTQVEDYREPPDPVMEDMNTPWRKPRNQQADDPK